LKWRTHSIFDIGINRALDQVSDEISGKVIVPVEDIRNKPNGINFSFGVVNILY
jgi:hypothetical protein